MSSKLSRVVAIVMLLGMIATAAMPAAAQEDVNEFGVPLPEDAAPWNQQVDVTYGEFGPWGHWAEGIYGLGSGESSNYYGQEPLLNINPNYELEGVIAESWEPNEDSTIWTFHIRPGLQWSDGTPLTANDWVYTFQYQADPENGFDFNWYYDPIKGLAEAAAGEIAPTEIGVSASDDLTLVFELKAPTPYWPALVSSAFPLPRQAVEKCGKRVWSVDPACYVASGPFILTKYERDRILVMEPNPNYKGVARPIVRRYVHIYAPVDRVDYWALFQDGEVAQLSTLELLPPTAQEEIISDPKYANDLLKTMTTLTTYIAMDTTKPPFDDLRVRQAFAMAIDRETICRDVLKGTCLATYGFMPLGFTNQNSALAEVMPYDPEKAAELLAEAGYPNGEGFPTVTYSIRTDNPVAPEAVAAMWQATLGVTAEIEQFDRTNFMQLMFARNFQIYQLAYGMDYPDAANLLTLMLTPTGRHEWNDPHFDELMTESAMLAGDPAARLEKLFEAEQYLIEQVGIIALTTPLGYNLRQPWFREGRWQMQIDGAPYGGSYCYFLSENGQRYYTKDVPSTWPPVDPAELNW